MTKHLINMFPHKFLTPSEMEIKKFINFYSQRQKYKSKSNNSNETRCQRWKGYIYLDKYTEFSGESK